MILLSVIVDAACHIICLWTSFSRAPLPFLIKLSLKIMLASLLAENPICLLLENLALTAVSQFQALFCPPGDLIAACRYCEQRSDSVRVYACSHIMRENQLGIKEQALCITGWLWRPLVWSKRGRCRDEITYVAAMKKDKRGMHARAYTKRIP